MVIKTVKNINIIEAGIYKLNSTLSFHQLKHAKNFVTGIIADPKGLPRNKLINLA